MKEQNILKYSPLVSVVIPVRNAKDYIQEALNSVFNQEYENLEILLIDDGSNDFDYKTLESQDNRIKVIRLEGKGVSHARNKGMTHAEGKYFAFLDADDVWFPGKLIAQIRYFESHPEVGVVFGEFIRWQSEEDNKFTPAENYFIECKNLTDSNPVRSGWLYTKLLLGLLVGMNTAVIRRETYLEIGGFDESLRIGEDYEFWLRASRVAEMHSLTGPVALYRIHSSSAMHKLDSRNHLARVLENAYSQWGLVNPDGTSISQNEFDHRIAKTQFSHGYLHYWHGDPAVARIAFFKAFEGGVLRWKSFIYCVLAGAKSIKARARVFERAKIIKNEMNKQRSDIYSADLISTTSTLTKSVGTRPKVLPLRPLETPIWARFLSASLCGGLTGNPRHALMIFTFHKIPDTTDDQYGGELTLEDFKSVLKILLENFNLIPLSEGIERLQRNALPRFAAAISFDDGYPNWMTGVVPLLEDHSVPATFFISTSQFEGRALWFERLYEIFRHVNGQLHLIIAVLKAQGIKLPDNSTASSINILNIIKYLPTARRDVVISECELALGVETKQLLFTQENAIELHSKGFAIGAHTVNHPILACCSVQEAKMEIAQSKDMLEIVLKAPIELFSYPNGVPGRDITPEHVRIVKGAGFEGAVTTALGAANHGNSIFQLPRFDPWTRTPRRLLAQYLMTLRRPFPSIDESEPH